MARPGGFDRLRVLRLAILDVLRLIQHEGVELDSAILLRVAPQQRVTGDDQIVRRNLREFFVAALVMQGEDAQVRRDLWPPPPS